MDFDSEAGAASISLDGLGINASVILNFADNVATTTVSDGAQLDAVGTTEILADAREEVDNLSLGAVGAEGSAFGGSVSVNWMEQTSEARVADGVDLNSGGLGASTQDVTIDARGETVLRNRVGRISISLAKGFGFAVDFNLINSQTNALVGAGTDINAGGDLSVTATSTEDYDSLTGLIAFGSDFSIAGASSDYVTNSSVAANLGAAGHNRRCARRRSGDRAWPIRSCC